MLERMATDSLVGAPQAEDAGGSFASAGAALLLVIGEPLTEDHRSLIQKEIAKGLQCWSHDSVDLNAELAEIANHASLGEEGPDGERVIRHRSEHLAVEVVVAPRAATVSASLHALLTAATPIKYVVYAGPVLAGCGSWLLQDDVFTLTNLLHTLRAPDVHNAFRQVPKGSLTLHVPAALDWSPTLVKQEAAKLLEIRVNPPSTLAEPSGVLQFTAYVASFTRARPLSALLQSSDVVGNIRFTRPTLYIFPGCQGDSALFGINGFNLLVNGGYSRRACFWDIVRHLDRVDALLLTHLGADNLFGVGSMLQRKAQDNVHPEIGYIYMNSGHKLKASPAGSQENVQQREPSLLFNLATEGTILTDLAHHVGLTSGSLTRPPSGNTLDPVNLYHKVGHGSLDMYVLNPVADSKELKDFYSQWSKQVTNFSPHQSPFPLPNLLSISALLVWRPANNKEAITRILFPGNTPQHKLIEGLEKVKHLDFLKHPSCCTADLTKSSATRKAGSVSTAKTATKSFTRAAPSPKTTESPRKIMESKSEKAKAAPTNAKGKVVKEDNNKRAARTKEREQREKEDKSKSASTSPSKSSVASSPTKNLTPTDTPKASTPSEPEAPQQPPPASPLLDLGPPASNEAGPLSNHLDDSSLDSGPASAMPLPDPVDVSLVAEPEAAHPRETSQRQIFEDDLDVVQPAEPEESPEPIHRSPEPLPQPAQDDTQPDHVMEAPQDLPKESSAPISRDRFEELGIYDDEEEAAEDGYGMRDDEEDPSGALPEEEEEFPQALPDPVAVPTHDPEPCSMESAFSRDQSDDLPCQEVLKPTAQPDLLAHAEEDVAAPAPADPAQDIPPSPPASKAIQPEFSFPSAGASTVDAAPPEFLEEPEVAAGMESLQQSIQYGVADDSRAMGGIREEEEEDLQAEDHIEESHQLMDYCEDEKHADKLAPKEPAEAEQRDVPDLLDHHEQAEVEQKEAGAEDHVEESQLSMEHFTEEKQSQEFATEEPAEAEQRDVPGLPEHHEQAEVEQRESGGADLIEESQHSMEHCMDEKQTQEFTPEEPAEAEQRGAPELPEDHDHAEEQQRESADAIREDSLEPENIIGHDHEEELEEAADHFAKDDSLEREHFLDERVQKEEEQKEAKPQETTEAFAREDSLEPEAMDTMDASDEDVDSEQHAREDSLEPQIQTSKEEQGIHEAEEDEEHPEQLEKQATEDGGAEDPHGISYTDQMTTDNKEQVDASEQEQEAEEIGEEPSNSFVYEKEVDISDEGEKPHEEEKPDLCPQEREDVVESQQEDSSIPAAFEKDETPTPLELMQSDPQSTASDSTTGKDQLYQSQEDSDSITGGTLDDDKDVDESFGMESKYSQLEEEPASGLEQTSSPQSDLPPLRSNGAVGANSQDDPFFTGTKDSAVSGHLDPFASGQLLDFQPEAASTEPSQPSPIDPFSLPLSAANSSPACPGGAQQPGKDAEFDLAQWDQPMGLPSPPPLDESATKSPANHVGGAVNGKPGTKNGAKSKPTADTKKSAASTRPKPPGDKTPASSSKRPSSAKPNSSGDAKPRTEKKPPATLEKKPAAPRSRPSTAPPKTESATTKSAAPSRQRAAPTSTRRPATASSRASPPTTKLPPLPPMTPFYVDLAYVPNHGDPSYCDAEFFKRVRARHYVLSTLSPAPATLNALLEGKGTWEDHGLPVTVIPTYDNDAMRHWMGLHREQLADLVIEVAPSASRCTIQLQDHEASCSAYRLEF